VLDSGAEGPGFKSQSRRCRAVLVFEHQTAWVSLTHSDVGLVTIWTFLEVIFGNFISLSLKITWPGHVLWVVS